MPVSAHLDIKAKECRECSRVCQHAKTCRSIKNVECLIINTSKKQRFFIHKSSEVVEWELILLTPAISLPVSTTGLKLVIKATGGLIRHLLVFFKLHLSRFQLKETKLNPYKENRLSVKTNYIKAHTHSWKQSLYPLTSGWTETRINNWCPNSLTVRFCWLWNS